MNMLSGHRPMGENQASLDVSRFEERIFAEDRLRPVSRRQLSEDMLNRHPHVAEDWFTAENFRADSDAFE